MITQGDIYWADLGPPVGSGPGFRRPLAVAQNDRLNQSSLRTTVCVLLTSNLRLASAKGNVLLTSRRTGLPRDSVVNVSQILTVDKRLLENPVGRIAKRDLETIFAGIDILLGR